MHTSGVYAAKLPDSASCSTPAAKLPGIIRNFVFRKRLYLGADVFLCLFLVSEPVVVSLDALCCRIQ
jgi:hypothetical protein